MIADQPERSALREYGRVVMKRPVAEPEGEPCRDARSPCELDQIAVRNCLAFERAQREESVDDPFDVPHGDRLGMGNDRHREHRGEDATPDAGSCGRTSWPREWHDSTWTQMFCLRRDGVSTDPPRESCRGSCDVLRIAKPICFSRKR